jgi:hypothetical protein
MENNKLNTLYFEGSSMKELYESIQNWQLENQKRLQSLTIQKDGAIFCCIALTNPTEVIIVDGTAYKGASVRYMESDDRPVGETLYSLMARSHYSRY